MEPINPIEEDSNRPLVLALLVLAVALLAAALVFLPLPAFGDHVTEPTAPITGIDLHVYQYPNPRTTTLACTGSEVVTFDNMRVESRVTATATPSEHWNERLTLYQVATNQFGQESIKYIWDVAWLHANIPPHQPVFESHQTNQQLGSLTGAKLRWVNTVTGRESGLVFTDSCTFIVG
jgi:hypothetical protein